MAICVETYLFHIGSRRFWNCICWMRECRSSYECTEYLLREDHNGLEGKVILWYNNAMELYKRYLDISIPGYVKEYLHQFGHRTTIKPQHQSYPAPEQIYGADAQNMKPLDMSP